jgi:hypothetical protein
MLILFSLNSILTTNAEGCLETLPKYRVAEAVTLTTFIHEVPESNIGLNTHCPEVFRSFPESLQANDQLKPCSPPFSLFLIRYALSSYHSDAISFSASYWQHR